MSMDAVDKRTPVQGGRERRATEDRGGGDYGVFVGSGKGVFRDGEGFSSLLIGLVKGGGTLNSLRSREVG